MATEYRVDVRNSAGSRIAQIIEFTSLAYTKRRNYPGEMTIALNIRNSKIDLFTDDIVLEVYRRNKALGLAWYKDFTALHRARNIVLNQKGVFTSTAQGAMTLLSDCIVAYPSASVNRSYFVSKEVETILHTLVKYNATASGTTGDGRIRNAPIKVSIGADSARGGIVASWDCSEENLLETMQNVATEQKVAFDVTYSGGTFTWMYVVNTDVSSSQIFALERGNVAEITYQKDRRNERTAIIVGGSGEDLDKVYTTTTGNSYHVTTNNREAYVSGTGEDTLEERTRLGVSKLDEVKSRDKITFSVIQTPSSYYGLHYNINYLVTGLALGNTYPLVVSEASVSLEESGKENISVTLEDI